MSDQVLDLSSMDAVALIVKPGETLAIVDCKGTMSADEAEGLQAYMELNCPGVKMLVVSGEGMQIAKVVPSIDETEYGIGDE